MKEWAITEVGCKTNVFAIFETEEEAKEGLGFYFGENRTDEYGIEWEVTKGW